MLITEPFILPDDVVLVPVAALPPEARLHLDQADGDVAITRWRSRTPSRIIDTASAELLEQFRSPKTLVEGVLNYSRTSGDNPERILEDAFPLIQKFIESRVLVPADSEAARTISLSFETGDMFAGFKVLRCVQVLEDAELYQVRGTDGQVAALKVARAAFTQELGPMLEREAGILRYLDGSVSPRLLDVGVFEDRPYVVVEWCSGIDASAAAQDLRRRSGDESRKALVHMCYEILRAFARLHAQNVVHADVHPRNILVARDNSIRIIDYGLARVDDDGPLNSVHRGGIAFFYEPEYARAHLLNERVPASTRMGEQYALAALAYLLVTGAHYLDFSVEKSAMLRQIAEDRPLSFSSRGLNSWPEMECVLAQALSKEPSARFPSVAAFAEALGEAAVSGEGRDLPIQKAATRQVSVGAETLLREVLQRVASSGPLFATGVTAPPTCSINYGAAGIAYALYRIACLRNDASLLSAADLWADKALFDSTSEHAFYYDELKITPETVGNVSPYHTISGIYAVQALISQAMGDPVSQQEAMDRFIMRVQAPCDNLDLTLGKSSVLLGCSLLLDAARGIELVDSSSLRLLGDRVMRDIWQRIDFFPTIAASRELMYLGIAHGWAGVLYATMRWCQSSGIPLPHTVPERLAQLGALGEPAGRGIRWPMRIPQYGRGYLGEHMPGWCNGSAGHLFLWLQAHRTFGEEKYLALAEETAWNVWEERGVVGSLCCGFAGQAYALLNLYRDTGETSWLRRAHDLANVAPSRLVGSDFPKESLYKGEIGVALLISDLAEPDASCMPFFEQEGWYR